MAELRLVTVIFEVRYKNRTPLIVDDKRINIVRQITKEEPSNSPKKNPILGLVLNHSQTKTRVVVEENRIAISVELDNEKESLSRLLESFEIVSNEVAYGGLEIDRLGLRTKWIYPWDGNFTKLLNLYKKNVYRDNPIINESSDIGVALNFEEDNYKVNYSSGPMKPAQAKTLLRFKAANLPHDFIFVDIDRYLENSPSQTFKKLVAFSGDSFDYGRNMANATVSFVLNE